MAETKREEAVSGKTMDDFFMEAVCNLMFVLKRYLRADISKAMLLAMVDIFKEDMEINSGMNIDNLIKEALRNVGESDAIRG